MTDLIPSKRKRVAIIVETSLSSGREILRGVARYAHQSNGWEVFHAPQGLSEKLPDWLTDWRGDGIIARVQNREKLDALKAFDIPTVDVLGLVSNSGIPLVHVDDEAISAMIAEHFLRREFRHFGFYGYAKENWSEHRRDGFRTACGDCESFHVFETEHFSTNDVTSDRERLKRWLRELPKPAGIMVCTDQGGLALLEACRAESIPVPEQIAIVGVDNDLPLCEIGSPALSSVRAGHSKVGYEAARLLDTMIDGVSPPKSPVLVSPIEVVIRRSSDTKAIRDLAVSIGVNFIHRNLAAPLTNTIVARAAGVSRTVFQRRFLSEMGTTIREYLTQQRLTRAHNLIVDSDLILSDIAERCGFRHQEYLGAVFKEHFRITPGTLRKKER